MVSTVCQDKADKLRNVASVAVRHVCGTELRTQSVFWICASIALSTFRLTRPNDTDSCNCQRQAAIHPAAASTAVLHARECAQSDLRKQELTIVAKHRSPTSADTRRSDTSWQGSEQGSHADESRQAAHGLQASPCSQSCLRLSGN